MATGYTAGVADGTIKTFRDYAYTCARAFGALVHMRDQPMGAPITVAEPSPYYMNEMTRTAERLHQLSTMSPSEAQRQCQIEHSKAMSRWREQCDDTAMRRVRYKAMLARVIHWKIPSEGHHDMRKFMRQQLIDSIDHDCSWIPEMPRIKRWPNWLADEIRQHQQWYERAVQAFRDESARTAQRNDWLQDLIESLPTD